jgi:hypothetical protein
LAGTGLGKYQNLVGPKPLQSAKAIRRQSASSLKQGYDRPDTVSRFATSNKMVKTMSVKTLPTSFASQFATHEAFKGQDKSNMNKPPTFKWKVEVSEKLLEGFGIKLDEKPAHGFIKCIPYSIGAKPGPRPIEQLQTRPRRKTPRFS